jgi:hypothetical protein
VPIYDIEIKELKELGFDWVFPTSQEPEPKPNRDNFVSSESENRLDPSQVIDCPHLDLFYGGILNPELDSEHDSRKFSNDFESYSDFEELLFHNDSKPVYHLNDHDLSFDSDVEVNDLKETTSSTAHTEPSQI